MSDHAPINQTRVLDLCPDRGTRAGTAPAIAVAMQQQTTGSGPGVRAEQRVAPGPRCDPRGQGRDVRPRRISARTGRWHGFKDMFDVLDPVVQLQAMMLGIAAVFRLSVGLIRQAA